MTKQHWIVVASADHFARGIAGGFVQAGHGRAAPLRRLRPGDGVICYAPVATFGGRDTLQAFVAGGVIGGAAPYEAEVADGDGRQMARLRVAWTRTGSVPIRPLLQKLELTAGRTNWGAAFRFGLVPISRHDAFLVGLALSLASARPATARTRRAA